MLRVQARSYPSELSKLQVRRTAHYPEKRDCGCSHSRPQARSHATPETGQYPVRISCASNYFFTNCRLHRTKDIVRLINVNIYDADAPGKGWQPGLGDKTKFYPRFSIEICERILLTGCTILHIGFRSRSFYFRACPRAPRATNLCIGKNSERVRATRKSHTAPHGTAPMSVLYCIARVIPTNTW
jgi:hypothetical protein